MHTFRRIQALHKATHVNTGECLVGACLLARNIHFLLTYIFLVRMIIYKMTMKKKVTITINTSTFPHQAHVLQFSNIFQHFVKSEQIKQTV